MVFFGAEAYISTVRRWAHLSKRMKERKEIFCLTFPH